MEQFAGTLTTTRYQEDEFWETMAHIALVAEKAGRYGPLFHNNFYAHTFYRAEGYEPNDLLWSFKYARP